MIDPSIGNRFEASSDWLKAIARNELSRRTVRGMNALKSMLAPKDAQQLYFVNTAELNERFCHYRAIYRYGRTSIARIAIAMNLGLLQLTARDRVYDAACELMGLKSGRAPGPSALRPLTKEEEIAVGLSVAFLQRAGVFAAPNVPRLCHMWVERRFKAILCSVAAYYSSDIAAIATRFLNLCLPLPGERVGRDQGVQ